MTDYEPATLSSTFTQPGGLVTRRQKDVLGREVSVTDPAGNVATYRYNSLGWKLSLTDPVTGTSAFAYDGSGRLVSQTDAAGGKVDMYYDAAGRLLSAALHLGLFLVIGLSGGRHDGMEAGEAPSTQLVLFEAVDVDHREGPDLAPLEPAVATAQIAEQFRAVAR